MTPRPRKRGNKDLPPNLYATSTGFEYRHPLTGKRHGVGSNRALAITRAKMLNERLMAQTDRTVDRIAGTAAPATVAAVLDRFRAEYLPERTYSKSTAAEIGYRLARIERELGETAWPAFTLEQLSDWLRPLSRAAYIKHRGQWVEIFRFACSVGLSERNLAELTLVKKPGERVRERWTLAQYQAARAIAEPWLQVAMDFALFSLQRREDLVTLRKREDFEAGRLLVRQGKTGKRLAIKPAGSLADVITRAKALHPFCPFVLGRKPERDIRKGKTHPYQITPGYLTRAVADVRDACGAFDGWPAEERPTLHELRSLGAHLYREAGFDETYVQSLLGHSDAAMTRHYLDGHKVEWDEVEAGLRIDLG